MNNQRALEILELSFDDINKSDFKDILKSHYRKLSLKYHPDKPGGSAENFEQLKIAYEFLLSPPPSNTGSNNATTGPNFENAAQIFSRAFTSVPASMCDNVFSFDKLKYNLNLTLTELYHGTTKTIVVKRNILNDSGKKLEQVSSSYSIKIAQGCYHGQEITIPNAGHQNIFGVINDLIIVINEINNTEFIRDKQNLIYQKKVTLHDAIIGGNLKITHLSGKTLDIAYKLKTPYDKISIPCMGMPIYGTTESYGDLKVEFIVIFPKSIPSHLLIDLDCLLSAVEYNQ